MGQQAELRCQCGEVQATVADASPTTVNRMVCYCDDCQAFAHYLGRGDLLDEHGGTDIVQVAPSSLSFVRGQERIVGMRLGPKGLYRFYADCCKTPVGNTVTPAVPFVGIVAQGFGGTEGADEIFGQPVARILGKYAIGTPPADSTKLNLPMLFRMVRMLLGWRFGGKAWPHPFFDRATRAPTRPVTVISPEEREALRRFCGPRPAEGQGGVA